jgi:hypothetical protein
VTIAPLDVPLYFFCWWKALMPAHLFPLGAWCPTDHLYNFLCIGTQSKFGAVFSTLHLIRVIASIWLLTINLASFVNGICQTLVLTEYNCVRFLLLSTLDSVEKSHH